LVLGGQALAQAPTYNRLSVDFNLGVNKALASQASGVARKLNFPHLDLGARYMLTNRGGLYAGLGFEKYGYTFNGIDGSTSSISIQTQAVLNLSNTVDLASAPKWKKVGMYLQAGPRFVINTNNYDGATGRMDLILGLSAALKAQYKVSSKLAINGGLEGMTYLLQNRSLDWMTKITHSPAGVSANLSLGVNYYLGEAAEHADWTPTNYGDAEAVNALKVKIEKAEKDMMDDDKDGVPNYLDQEPGTAAGANVDTKGKTVKVVKVVDMDGDGVLDVDDFCPTIKGVSSANGCPDKDGDSVYDFVDKCPNSAGLAADGGCPVVTKETKEKLKAAEGIQFDNGKATIVKKSLTNLDAIAKIMLANPSYNLDINGHTDNVGDPAKNLKLSEDRTKAVKAYLMGKGVAENRMKATGYGDTQPKASNATAKGKAANRRVEFIIKFQE